MNTAVDRFKTRSFDYLLDAVHHLLNCYVPDQICEQCQDIEKFLVQAEKAQGKA